MKNKTLLVCTLISAFFCITEMQAQLEKGNSLLNIGFGMNSYYTSSSGFSTTLPPLEGSFEVMTSEKFSLGAFIGAYGAKYENEFESMGIVIDTEIKYSYLNFGGLANYYFVNDESWNIYVGGRLGYVSSSAKVSHSSNVSTIDEDSFLNTAGATASGILFGANLGGRYNLSEKLALNAELGFGIALLKFGVTFKL